MPTRSAVPTLARVPWPLVIAWMIVAAGCSGEAPLPGDPLRLATSSLPGPVLGEAYRADIVAVGGLRPYAVRLEEGELPPGVTLQGGVLVGTPTELGRFEFTLAVSDANLAQTFATYDVVVRDVPEPRVALTPPDTEVRGRVELRARVEEAYDLRAVRLRVAWDDDAPALPEDAVRASRDDVALLWRADDEGVSVDVAFLGEGFGGDGELFRLVLDVEGPVRLGYGLEVETLYAGRHAFTSRREGAPAGGASPGGTTGGDDGVGDDASPTDGTGDGVAGGTNDPTNEGAPADGAP